VVGNDDRTTRNILIAGIDKAADKTNIQTVKRISELEAELLRLKAPKKRTFKVKQKISGLFRSVQRAKNYNDCKK
jgi:hypothetical protein